MRSSFVVSPRGEAERGHRAPPEDAAYGPHETDLADGHQASLHSMYISFRLLNPISISGRATLDALQAVSSTPYSFALASLAGTRVSMSGHQGYASGASLGIEPGKLALRFSRKALTPSLFSAPENIE